MSSRLASLLVHEGHVSPVRMAEAFQRQVIYGGALDTALLEMGLVGRRVLLEVLGRVTGLPVLGEVPPGDLTALARELPEAEAERFQMVPVRVREGRLEVAMTEPANPEPLQKLSPLLGRRVYVWIVPEYMLQLLRERVYGTPLSARFASLWAKAGRSQSAAAGRQRSEKRSPQRPQERTQERPQERSGERDRQDASPRSLPDTVTVREGPPKGPRGEVSVVPAGAEKAAVPPAAPVALPSDVTPAVVERERPGAGTAAVQGEGQDQHQDQRQETVSEEGGRVVEKHFPMSPLLGEVTESILDAKTKVWARPPAPVAPVVKEEPAVLADEEDEPEIFIEDEIIGGGPDSLAEEHGAPTGAGGQGLLHDGGRDTGGLLGAEELLDAESEEALPEGEGDDGSGDEEQGVEVVAANVGEAVIENEEILVPAGDSPAEAAVVSETDEGVVSSEVDDEETRRENFLRALQPHVDAAAGSTPALEEGHSLSDQVRQSDSVPSIEIPTREPMPLEIERALTELDEAAERDAVFETLCQLVRNYFDVAVLFAVKGERVTARAGLGRQWLSRDALAELELSLDEPSSFRTAVEGRSPYLGQLGNDRPMAGLLSALGRPVPVRGALFPLVLRSRVVAVLFGVAGSQEFGELPLADLTRVMAEAAQALQRIILVSKSGAHALHLRGATGGGEARGRGTNGPTAVVPEESAVPEDTERLTLLEGPLGENLMQLVDIVAADREGALAAGEALVAAGEPGAMALAARLPGPLRLRRHSFATPLSPLSAYGPLFGLVARFGRAIVPYLLARLDEAATEVRFYTALAFSELPFPEAVSHLGERLFDVDLGVRRAAATALGRFPPSPEMQALMESLRRTLAAPDVGRQRLAVEALGELRDAASLPRLMELLSKRDELMIIAVRRALITIAKQDFGTSRWRWRGWWEENRHRSRIDWLLEGLNHSDAAVRQSASDELGAITSEVFGYHVALPRPAREEARQRWLKWYKQQAAVDAGGGQGQNS